MQDNNLYNSSFSIAETTENYTRLKDLYDADKSIKEKLAGSFIISTRETTRETDEPAKDLLLCSDTIYNLSESNVNAKYPLSYRKNDLTLSNELIIEYDKEQFKIIENKLTLNEEYINNIIENSETIKDLKATIQELLNTIENKG
jgi:hypothetical protein